MLKAKSVCAAPNCKNEFTKNHPDHKFCSHRCRYRAHKRKSYDSRKEKGLCPQCGNELDVTTASYCSNCQEYFKERYYENK